MNLEIAGSKSLSELESVIERGKQAFVEVGRALAEIRDRRLYKETHSRFEDYCRERWGFGRPAAHQYINASEVIGNLSACADDAPILKELSLPSISQARHMAVLEPDQQRELAARTDFANTTVLELKEKIEEIRIPMSGKAKINADAAVKKMAVGISTVEGCCYGLMLVDTEQIVSAGRDEALRWVEKAEKCAAELRSFARKLEKAINA